MNARLPSLSVLALTTLLSACGGAGPYGHARQYAPLSAEETYLGQETFVTYEDLTRGPSDYASTTIGWFGFVRSVEELSGGQALVTLTHRTLAQRNLCSDDSASSCRVTVSESDGGRYQVRLTLRDEDRQGPERLWNGSLIKVYASPTGEMDGYNGPLLEAAYYRHWPRGTFVTTAARGTMRR